MFRPVLLALLVLASSAHAYPCNSGQSEMSVEGVEGVFCVDASPICIADISNGACPMVSAALPGGSYCGLVATGVYGCKTGSAPPPTMVPMELPTEAPTEAPTQPPTMAPPTQAPMTDAPTTTPVPVFAPTPSPTDGSQCGDGDYEMSVEGVPGIFCLSQGPICMAETSTGTCPGPQNGLPNGSYCGRVASGVFGCKVNVDGATQAPVPEPAVTTTAPVTITVAPTPAPTPIPTPAPTPVPSWAPVPTVVAPSPVGSCGVNGSAMSVEGVVSVFCVNEPACVADRATGNCPGAQPGLEFGSYCDKLSRTGAFGCKPYSSPNTPNSVVYPSVLNCAGNAKGDTPVSIVGAGTFCAPQPVCAGSVKGNCPQAQDGLGSDSFCAMIGTGVMGCVMAA